MAAAEITYSRELSFWGVLSVSKRIINAHSRHFLALSVVFLLPLSFSLIIYPTLENTLAQPNSFIPQQSLFLSLSATYPEPTKTQIIIPLLYCFFFLLLSVLAVASITYSTFHGFYGRPVKIVSSVKSIFYSFFPLLCTLFVAQIIMSLIILFYALLVALVYKSLLLLGFEISLDSKYFVGFMIFVAVVTMLSLVAVQVNWALANVIVVVESKWGYEPLRRSASLVRGMKGVSLSMLLFYGIAIWFLVWACWTSVINGSEAGGLWSFAFVVQTVVGSGFVTLLMLQNVAANVVLYMYCKAFQGELASEIAEEFARDYVSLPFDCEKVPHVVSVQV
ncbi:hypothetical protein M9H77_09916 [Catharanthus roseus]|uniref:Uncharacterized protein n=1 Tax=Catharanthus roseus TaxID=4058 RepID=A0ACC0C243_CATRO|nr:hypothetical protein M9H77_09916 [Catharanthus roseus]